MASVFFDSQSQGVVDQGAHTVLVTLNGHFTGGVGPEFVYYGFNWGIGAYSDAGPNSSVAFFGLPPGGDDSGSASFTYTPGQVLPGYVTQAQLLADRTYQARAQLNRYRDSDFAFLGVVYSGNSNFKNNAVTATASAPTSSSVGSVTATIACLYFPNTADSSASVQLQYKRNIDVGWTDAGAPDVVSGYSQLSISRNISGLLGSTLYDVRLVITRTTNNATSLTSATSQFTTLSADPAITTDPASGVGPTVATLNGTLDPNLNSTIWYFEWGLTVAYGNVTATQGPDSGNSPFAISAILSGLSPNTLYHFRGVAQVGNPTFVGADRTFTTTAPAGSQDKMPNIISVFAKYGAAFSMDFCVETPVSTGSDQFLSAVVPWVAGDVVVYQDGASAGNIDVLPTRVGATPVYNLAVTGAKMQAQQTSVLLRDASGGPLWRDLLIIITTRLRLGQIDVDATAIGGNTTAMSLVGVGTGYGLFAKGSSGIRGEAQGAAGHGVQGVGIGSGFGMSASAASAGPAFSNNFFTQLEGPEPSTLPGDNEAIGRILQYLKRRETNRVTQDSNFQTWYKDNSITVMTKRAVSDDTVTQTQGKLIAP